MIAYTYSPCRATQVAAVVAMTFVSASPASSQTPANAAVTSQVASWFAGAELAAPGKWAIVVADASGTPLWSVNPDEQMTPASTVKLFTTGFARSVVGSGARQATRFLSSGTITPSGELVGQWALEMNGDPTLERLPGTGPTLDDLAQQLVQAGVKRINGSLHVQTSSGAAATAAYPSVWSPRHRGRVFAPPIGAVMLHENIVFVTVAPAAKAGARALLIGDSPRGIASLVTVTATTGGRRTRLGLAPQKDGGWTLTGRIALRAAPHQIVAVANDPLKVLGAAWGSSLSRAGITWNRTDFPTIGSSASPPRAIATVSSTVFDSMASEINRRSLNLGAEALLQWATSHGANGATALTEFVRRISGVNEVNLVDGSGLSEEDHASPTTFVRYLAKFPQTEAGKNFPLLLPANGEGTLRRMNRGLPGPGIVRAKTGTLRDVVTVSGYLGRSDGVLIVSLMYKGARPWVARQQQWTLFRLLGAQGSVIPGDSEPGDTSGHVEAR